MVRQPLVADSNSMLFDDPQTAVDGLALQKLGVAAPLMPRHGACPGGPDAER